MNAPRCPNALRRFACARFRVLVTPLRSTVTTLYRRDPLISDMVHLGAGGLQSK